jgi:hypothetical protein
MDDLPSTRRRRIADRAAAVLLAGVVLALYLATLYPDVVASGDSAKFQYLGRVLGTAHPPGYPFYVLVTHLFSQVPMGTLAWRLNVFSALAGVLAVVCTYASARRLSGGILPSLLLGLGLASGLLFWNKSLAAEVYTLTALLLMFAIWRVIVWRDEKKDRDLLLAVAALSLGLGNHLSIAVVAPAFVAYVLVTDARRALRRRVLLASLGLVAIGIGQYGFIVLRTWQETPFLEARAASVSELMTVIRAERYKDAMFQFGWYELLTVRLPLLGRQLLQELTPAGAVLVVFGAIAGAWRSPKDVLLLGGSVAAILALTANVDADSAGFATAALPPLWLLAVFAPGMQGAVRPARRAVPTVLTLALLIGTVAAELRGNFRFADHSDRTLERRLWSAVFESVPDRAAVVSESYVHDQGLLYMLAGEGLGQTRHIEFVPRDAATLDRLFRQEHRTIVAFDAAVRELSRLDFQFTPLPLLDWPIPRLVGSSRRDRFVVAAIQPDAAALLAAEAPALMERFGGTWRPSRNPGRYALVGLPIGGATAVEAQNQADLTLHVARGRAVGPRAVLPRDVDVRVTAKEIAIAVGGEEPFRTTAPFAVLVLGEGGQIRQRLVPASLASLRPPLEAVRAYAMSASTICDDIGDRVWHDLARVSGRELLVRINNYQAFDAHVVLYVAAASAPSPRLVESRGPRPARLTVTTMTAADRAARSNADGFPAALPQSPHLMRLQIDVNDHGDESANVLDFGVEPAAVWAIGTADRVAAPRVRACRRTVQASTFVP